MFIIFFGAPGAGKGTQAKILCQKYNLSHISTGDILRDAAAHNTPWGLEAKTRMDQGKLVPDNVMIELIKEVLQRPENASGVILDGFPRTIAQADALIEFLKAGHQENVVLLFLEVNDDEIVRRLSSRRSCTNCHEIFGAADVENSNICPICKSVDTIFIREDDREEVVRKRLSIYRANTLPVIDHLRNAVTIETIDALRTKEDVTADIVSRLDKLSSQS